MKCRFCNNSLNHEFVDLQNAPPSNSYLTNEELNEPEAYYPLRVFVCEKCWLVQVDEYKKSGEIFDKNYAYFSSMSKSWLEHSRSYVSMISERLKLNETSKVIEIASNDGYLLQYFKQFNIQCLGIEPTESTASVSISKGIDTIINFFDVSLAQRLKEQDRRADLILGNNVLAHVPDINAFVAGLKIALLESGSITMEFPHLLNLIQFYQFDTVYHEHFSYLSLFFVNELFKSHRLKVYDVEELNTHGGSLRIYACHEDNKEMSLSINVANIISKEKAFGLNKISKYKGFQKKVNQLKYAFLNFLLEQKKLGKKVAAYGAAAKGNTLLNYCGIKNDLIDFVVDAAPSKQGKFLPGSHIPIVSEENLRNYKPDFIVIFPWNIKEEIVNQLAYTSEWGAKFVVAVPLLEVF